ENESARDKLIYAEPTSTPSIWRGQIARQPPSGVKGHAVHSHGPAPHQRFKARQGRQHMHLVNRLDQLQERRAAVDAVGMFQCRGVAQMSGPVSGLDIGMRTI